MRQHLATQPAVVSTLKRATHELEPLDTNPLPAKRAKQDLITSPDQSASALSCHSSPTAPPLALPLSLAERKSLRNRLVVLKAAIALKAVC